MKFKDESVRTITLELTVAEAHDLRLDLQVGEDEYGLTAHAQGILGHLRSVTLEVGK